MLGKKEVVKMTKFRQRLSRNTQKLLFLVWVLIPFIPIALLWNWLNPVGFWQALVMLIVCCFVYAVLLVVVFIIGCILNDYL